MSAVLGTEFEQVLAVELHLTASDSVGRVASEHSTERTLSATVRSHDRMHLAWLDGEVYTL